MERYEYAEKIKDRLVKLLNMNPECKRILKDCNYKCDYKLNKNAELEVITFAFWDIIKCYNNGAYIIPEHGLDRKILTYDNFDELLEN